MRDRPVNRCAFRGCAYVGHWAEGERCPQHRHSDYDPPVPGGHFPDWEDDE